MFRRKFVFLLVALSVVSQPVLADKLHERLNNDRSQLKSISKTLTIQKQQESAAVKKALALQSSITDLQNAIQQNNETIGKHRDTIVSLESEKQDLEVKRQKDTHAWGRYLRTQYEISGVGYLDWFFQATSMENLLTRAEYAWAITNAYKKLENQVAVDIQTINAKQRTVQGEKDQLVQAVQYRQQIKSSLTTTYAKQKETVGQLTDSERQTVAARINVQNDIIKTEALIKQQELEAKLAEKNKKQAAAQLAGDRNMNKVATPVHINGTNAQLLAYAEQFIGTPYVWGGTSPQPGFDCSGYVQYVYAHFGVKLYRVARDQFQEGQSISRSNLEPGDLVFFTTYAAGASHVGIYVGNGTMIDSSDDGVGYDSLSLPYWSSRYLGARRILAN